MPLPRKLSTQPAAAMPAAQDLPAKDCEERSNGGPNGESNGKFEGQSPGNGEALPPDAMPVTLSPGPAAPLPGLLPALLPVLLPADKARSPRWFVAAIFLALAVGVALRWMALGHQSLWFDEGFTAWVVSLRSREIFPVIRADVSPPLYYFLLKGWTTVFGMSETALRSLSALFATLGFGIFYLLCRQIFRSRAAIAAAMWLMAIEVLQIQYAREARFYALMSLLALAALLALVKYLEKGSPHWFLAVVLISAASVYTNNIMWFYLAALNVVWLLWPAGDVDGRWPPRKSDRFMSKRRRVADLVRADCWIVAFYLVWAPYLIEQLARVQKSFWASPPSWGQFWETLAVMAGVKENYPAILFYKVPVLWRAPYEWVCGLTIGLVCVVLLRVAFSAIAERRQSASIAGGFEAAAQPQAAQLRRIYGRRILALAVYALLPLVVVFFYSLARKPIFIERIFVASTAVVPILIAAGIGIPLRAKRSLGQILCWAAVGVLLIWGGITTYGMLRWETKEQWRSAVEYLVNEPSAQGEGVANVSGNPAAAVNRNHWRLIVFVGNEGEMLFDYYIARFNLTGPELAQRGLTWTGAPDSYFATQPPVTTQRVMMPGDLRLLRQEIESGEFDEVDLVLSHTAWSDPHLLTQQYLDQTCTFRGERLFKDITIRAYDVNE